VSRDKFKLVSSLQDLDKYKDLYLDFHKSYNNYILTSFTVEMTVLGFISNLSDFAGFVSISRLPQPDKALITHKAIANSLDICYSRKLKQN